jgi:hypothetical protein
MKTLDEKKRAAPRAINNNLAEWKMRIVSLPTHVRESASAPRSGRVVETAAAEG